MQCRLGPLSASRSTTEGLGQWGSLVGLHRGGSLNPYTSSRASARTQRAAVFPRAEEAHFIGRGVLAYSRLCPLLAVTPGPSAQTLALARLLSWGGCEGADTQHGCCVLSGQDQPPVSDPPRGVSPCQGQWLLFGWPGSGTCQFRLPDCSCSFGVKS